MQDFTKLLPKHPSTDKKLGRKQFWLSVFFTFYPIVLASCYTAKLLITGDGNIYLGMLSLAILLISLKPSFDFCRKHEQYYLWGITGYANALMIELLCRKDAGFEEFYNENIKMSTHEMKRLIQDMYDDDKKEAA